MSKANQGGAVCVTGASGYLGTHLVRELLERGYSVRATVRDAGNEDKTARLRELSGASDRLKLFSADLTQAGSYDEPLAGSRWLVHAAAAVQLKSKNPQRDIVEPTIQGTRHVLDAALKAGTVEHMALISSVAAVHDTHMRPGHVYTEADWNEDATVEKYPYGLAKVQSEKMFHEFCAGGAGRPGGFAVHPALVIGPLYLPAHSATSVSVVRDLMLSKFHGCPRMSFGVVDVRDVATAIVNGLERRAGGRFVLSTQTMMLQDIAGVIAREFPEYRVQTRQLPDFVMYLAALFDSRLTFAYLRRNLGYRKQFSQERAIRELGLRPRDAARSVVDTCRSLIDLGLARRK
jgi:nucleoside-diphosphate-sugar epimerase